MNDLNNNRALLISGNLPADEFRRVKLMATSQLDTGNNELGLDMIVRDENGDQLDTNKTCTTELYEHHMKAVDRIIKANVSLGTIKDKFIETIDIEKLKFTFQKSKLSLVRILFLRSTLEYCSSCI